MKKLDELTLDELKVVYEKNSKLRHEVFDLFFEDINGMVEDEYLKFWDDRAIDYLLGIEKGAYFVCCNIDLFLDGLQKAQKNFGFLHCVYDKLIAKAVTLRERLKHSEDLNREQERVMDNRLDQLLQELEKACFKRIMSEYETAYDNDNCLQYFIEFCADTLYNTCEVDDNYILYRTYTKCYK